MTVRNWLSKDWTFRPIQDVNQWSPAGWPSAGDDLFVRSGSMSISFFDTTSATVWLGGFGREGQFAGLRLDYATVKVDLGISAVDNAGSGLQGVELANRLNDSRNSFIQIGHTSTLYLDSGGGRTGASYNWTQIDAGAVLTTHNVYRNGGSAITYGNGLLDNKETTVSNTTLTVATDVAGVGQFDLELSAHMEFTKGVSDGQRVNVGGGSLLVVDDTSRFHATIVVGETPGNIILRGINISTVEFWRSSETRGILEFRDGTDHTTGIASLNWVARGGIDVIGESDGSVLIRSAGAAIGANERLIDTFQTV